MVGRCRGPAILYNTPCFLPRLSALFCASCRQLARTTTQQEYEGVDCTAGCGVMLARFGCFFAVITAAGTTWPLVL